MALGADHLRPPNVAYAPGSATARQNDVEEHDNEIIPRGPVPGTVDHRCPSKVSVSPLGFTATQNLRVAHDTSISRSTSARVPRVCCVDHEWPSKVPRVLAAPTVPLAPTVVQKLTVGHDTP
jgi:hypothetical protein